MQGITNVSKTARELLHRIHRIDADNYPEVSTNVKSNAFFQLCLNDAYLNGSSDSRSEKTLKHLLYYCRPCTICSL